jgi:cytochrome c oxidase assembly protein Cox11
MKNKGWLISALALIGLTACQKTSDNANETTLTASTTQAVVGQTVSVQVSSNRNAASWTVTPSSSVAQTYAITTRTVNYFTFNRAGTYTVGVRMRNIACDSTHQSLDSCWHHGGGDAGGCHRGIDSASVTIKVAN